METYRFDVSCKINEKTGKKIVNLKDIMDKLPDYVKISELINKLIADAEGKKKQILELELLRFLLNKDIWKKMHDTSDVVRLMANINNEDLKTLNIDYNILLQIKKLKDVRLLKLLEQYKDLDFVVAILQTEEILNAAVVEDPNYESMETGNLGYDVYVKTRK